MLLLRRLNLVTVFLLVAMGLASYTGCAIGDAAKAPELVCTTWQWRELAETEPASLSLVPQPESYTLVFHPDGTLAIQADCNMATGLYILECNALTISLGACTLAFCGEESLDQLYLGLLGNVGSYCIEDGRLVLTVKEDASRVAFEEE